MMEDNPTPLGADSRLCGVVSLDTVWGRKRTSSLDLLAVALGDDIERPKARVRGSERRFGSPRVDGGKDRYPSLRDIDQRNEHRSSGRAIERRGNFREAFRRCNTPAHETCTTAMLRDTHRLSPDLDASQRKQGGELKGLTVDA